MTKEIKTQTEEATYMIDRLNDILSIAGSCAQIDDLNTVGDYFVKAARDYAEREKSMLSARAEAQNMLNFFYPKDEDYEEYDEDDGEDENP